MNDRIYRLAKWFRPDLENMSGQHRMSATADVLTLLYATPLLAIGLVWLVKVTDWASIRQKWQVYLLMGVLLYIFDRLRFFFITEIRTGGYANSDGALDGIVLWSAVLMLGPTALWLKVIWNLLKFVDYIYRERTPQAYWSRSRMLFADVSTDTLATLVALMVYSWLGGSIPISDYSINSIAPALAAVFIQYLGTILIYSGYMAYVIWSLKAVLKTSPRPVISFFVMALTLPALANPFGILAAGIYTSAGFGEFMFIIMGLLLTAVLARRLSQAAEYSRQQSRQIEQLEKLGRAILDEAPDKSDLPEVLKKYVSTMFASLGILVWTTSRGILLQEPPAVSYDWELAWKWLETHTNAQVVMPNENLPWNPAVAYIGPIILCPIQDVESGKLIGEIIIEMQSISILWDQRTIQRQLPAVQALAAQVASALHQAQTYEQTLAMQKTMQELALARTIQASFLPETIPSLPGWQLTATLEPARQIAGDFYDFIRLPDGKMGILIADVADKGLGSALYMALSGTLIRTFANQFYNEPSMVLKTANQHILRNARANLFVTVFFAVLDPASGVLCYSNAGHTPPILISTSNGIKTLKNTGMPLGIDEDNNWSQEEVLISPGEMLILYTDGVTDAQNNEGEFIDRKLIFNIAQKGISHSVRDVQNAILDRVHHFVGDAPRFDDITLVIVGRENNKQ